MASSDDLLAMFTAKVKQQNGSSIVEIPSHEIDLGTLSNGTTYRVAVLEPLHSQNATDVAEESDSSEPPVQKGERIEVEIEDIGEQGDGIARVGPGYIVFVAGADMGDRVTIEIGKVLDNYAFAEVVEPEPIAG